MGLLSMFSATALPWALAGWPWPPCCPTAHFPGRGAFSPAPARRAATRRSVRQHVLCSLLATCCAQWEFRFPVSQNPPSASDCAQLPALPPKPGGLTCTDMESV